MNKYPAIKRIRNIFLFLLAASLLIWGHYSNEQFKERNGINITSGATRLAD